MRSDKEIDAEIALLKSMQPFIRNTGFCPNNTKKLAAQIEVLEKRMTEQQIESKWYLDETAEEYQDGDNDVWSAACEAHDWMNEENDQTALSADDGWGGLAKGNGWKPTPHTTGGERT